MENRTEREPCETDLSDAEWAIIEPLIPGGKPGGRPRETNIREVINAIFYLLRTDCAWRHLPHDFPPPGTVYDYFSLGTRDGTLKQIHDALRRQVRVQAEREVEPSAACIDSQSAKTNEQGDIDGYDAGRTETGTRSVCPGLPPCYENGGLTSIHVASRFPSWTPLVQAPPADTCQLTCSISRVRGDAEACSAEDQCRDRPIAEWLNWLCDHGSALGRC